MRQQYQVTLLCKSGKYRPVSAIVTLEQETAEDLTTNEEKRKEIQKKGIVKICQQRLWDKTDLIKGEYTKCKIRVYDKEKIAQENEERYEQIKEQKYQSGEWKRPKGKQSKE